ncbi:uncharacterized protein (TIGR02302 family) [Pacificibacter maritimus]|uniref:Uncharacterized protein (TIGR02302 family) n=1 Tax=Pacificibacter maritimus TaxID=762213 RepID=A0A3N4U628_9RHOB|nr:DUF4175 family protein [Pacificibacter maritimus]RPE66243.1 uncharacterized protein (TIGR02302 family) [Pacificibacter maritimus]
MTDKTPIQIAAEKHVGRIVRHSFAFLYVERVAQAFWLCFVILCVGLVGLLWNVPAVIGRLPFASICAVLWSASFALGLMKFQRPTRSQARARIDANLQNRPLQALEDSLSDADEGPATRALWQIHLNRMAEAAQQASAPLPQIRLAARDPYALRLIAVGALIMSALFGPSVDWRAGTAQRNIIAAGPAWEGWIEPPAHTGKPTLYLADLPQSFAAPAASKVIIRLYGEEDALKLRQTVTEAAQDQAGSSHEFALEKNGEIEIKGDKDQLWSVALLPDHAPVARLVGEMERAVSGEMRQAFLLSDDFGVTRAELTISTDFDAVQARYGYKVAQEPRVDIRLEIPLPRSASAAEIEGLVAENLSQHPFSGLPVQVNLTAWDGAGMRGQAEPLFGILPGRRFFDPLAAALIDVRRELLWSRENAPRASRVIRAISYGQDEINGGDQALFLRLRSIAGLIETDGQSMTKATVDEVAQSLWDIAIELEDGELSEALERLRRAQDRLAQAMRDGATDEEIAKLMQELRAASDAYIRQLAEQQSDQDTQSGQSQETRDITGDQLQELMDRIQELMTQGRMAEAQQLMQMLNELLENMQVTQGAGQGSAGEAMENLQETLRDQQQLNDDTFSELQNQFGDQGEQGGQGDQDGGSLSDRQQALRDGLGSQSAPSQGGQGDAAGEALEGAENSMSDAEQALRDNDLAGALDSQARAMDLLRQGMQALQDQQSQDGTGQSEQDGQGQRSAQNGQDPLGRGAGDQGNGALGGEGSNEADAGRRQAKDLADEIKRRSAQQDRDANERDYLNRLLDRF